MKETILALLESLYPRDTSFLNHSNPFELLVATILSAQCTDERVNRITPPLFEAYPDAFSLGRASVEDVAEFIKSAGLWRTKARNLVKTAQILAEKHQGAVPGTREELEALPGVGRKTASVVLANAFQVPAIAVDTHVFRVANRLGLAEAKDPRQTEEQLMAAIPEEKWASAHRWLIDHGRAVCKARKPLCSSCPLNPYCAYYNAEKLSG